MSGDVIYNPHTTEQLDNVTMCVVFNTSFCPFTVYNDSVKFLCSLNFTMICHGQGISFGFSVVLQLFQITILLAFLNYYFHTFLLVLSQLILLCLENYKYHSHFLVQSINFVTGVGALQPRVLIYFITLVVQIFMTDNVRQSRTK